MENVKTIATKLLLLVIAVPFALGALFTLYDNVIAKDNSKQHFEAVTQWETSHKSVLLTLEQAKKAACESEKTGARLKLVANSFGVLELAPDKIYQLVDKRDSKDCSF